MTFNSCLTKEEKTDESSTSEGAKESEDADKPIQEIQNIDVLKKEVGKYYDFIELVFYSKKHTNKKLVISSENKRQNQKSINKNDRKVNVKVNREVFGFHPHYGKEDAYQNYNYKVLTSLSYFAYDLNPKTGGYKSIREWETTPVIDLAKNNNCKIYLTVTNFGSDNNRIFLNNLNAQENSINVIDNLLTERQANGVTLDFEVLPKDLKDKYTTYVKNLSNRLKQNGMKVNLTLPPIDKEKVFDIKALSEHVEFFIVMGKNFYGKGNTVAGPVAPLNKGDRWTVGNLKTSIDTFLKAGLPNNKLILSLPYYGSRWTATDTIMGSANAKFKDHLSYKTIKKIYPQKPKYDKESGSAYLILSESDKHEIVWFDDAKTLEEKYDYVLEENFAGVGIWALGYDGEHPELWNALSAKFKIKKQLIEPNQPIVVQKSWWSLIPNTGVLKVFFYMLGIILLLGFLLSLRNPVIRDIVFQNIWIKNIILLGIPLLVLIILFAEKYFASGFLIFISLIMGYIIYHLYVRTEQYNKNHNRIP